MERKIYYARVSIRVAGEYHTFLHVPTYVRKALRYYSNAVIPTEPVTRSHGCNTNISYIKIIQIAVEVSNVGIVYAL